MSFSNFSKTQNKYNKLISNTITKRERVKWESGDKEENWTTVGNSGDEELIELIFIENDLKGPFG